MSTINDAFINALLADASYVEDLQPNQSPDTLRGRLSTRMTPTLAEFIANNFTVASAINSSDTPLDGSGFDAVVWRGLPNGLFPGKVYVSMRGTEPGGADLFIADVALALTGNAGQQVIDMVNWWLKISTPEGTNNARQIGLEAVPTGNTDPNRAPTYDAAAPVVSTAVDTTRGATALRVANDINWSKAA